MKRIYHILALLAFVNLFAIAGFVGFLFSSGRLNAERVDQIGIVLRGKFPTSQPATQPAVTSAPAEPSRSEIVRAAAQKEYYQLLAERHERELQDRQSLNQSIQLDVIRRLEEIEKAKADLQEERKKAAEQGQDDGFAKVLEMYSGMDPVKAKDLLRTQNKEADAVQVLMQLDSSRTKKIVNACKTPEEMLWIGRILNQINKLNKPGGGVDGPSPASQGS
jgi:flagellar motility protein MotE (MotC chaperone)